MRPGDAERLLDGLLGVQAEVGFAVFDRAHRYVAINATMAEVDGWAIVDHLGRSPRDIQPPDRADQIEQMVDQVFASGEPVQFDESRSDSVYRWSWYPLSESNEVTSVAVFMVDDTTARQVANALRHSRARNARLLAVADDLSRAITVSDVIEAVAELGERMIGADWSAVALLGSNDGYPLSSGSAVPAWVTTARAQWPDDAATPVAEVARTGWPAFLSTRDQARKEYPDPRFADFLDHTPEQSWAVLPLTGSSGRLGVLRFGFMREQPFDSEQCRFLRAVAQQCSVALERARLFEQERTAAAALASGLLPARLPGVDGLELGARSWPGSRDHAVGGDWYDAFVLPGGQVALAVGDVMGHGLPAAAGMGQLKAALRALALTDPDPGAVLTGLDRVVEKGDQVEMATVVYAVVDPATGEACFGDAGHPPLVHARSTGTPFLIAPDPPTTPIGVPERRYGEQVRLRHGDVVLGYTDGLVETRSRPLDDGLSALVECVGTVQSEELGIILDTVTASLHDPTTTDDSTILGLRWSGA